MKKNPQKHGSSWYDGTHYTNKQPFATFLTCRGKIVEESLAILVEKIKILVPQPTKARVLEIGPGTSPILPYFSFQESFFVEQSEKITQILAQQLQKMKTTSRFHFIVGDVQNLPFSKTNPFDLVVMNEILTHVSPPLRVSVVKQVAGICNALLLVERPQTKFGQFKDQFYPELTVGRTPQQWRDLHATYTRIAPIISMLKKMGWTVREKKVVAGETYTILYAWKKGTRVTS